MTATPKKSDFLFLADEEEGWNELSYLPNSSNFIAAEREHRDTFECDDEQPPSAQFQAMVVNLLQVGTELTKIQFEVEELKAQNAELQKNMKILIQMVSEKQGIEGEDFHLACEAFTTPERENSAFDILQKKEKKVEFFH